MLALGIVALHFLELGTEDSIFRSESFHLVQGVLERIVQEFILE